MKWSAKEWKEKINSCNTECVPFLRSLKVRRVDGSIFSVGISELPEEEQMVIMGRLVMEFMEE